MSEINRGYLDFVDSLTSLQKKGMSFKTIIFKVIINLIRLIGIPLLILYSLALIILLQIRLLFTDKTQISDFHLKAIEYIDEFTYQYPMHLYSVIYKSYELAFIKENIKNVLEKNNSSIVELAIGEGSLSKRIFSQDDSVVGLDINPYSLLHTKNMKHVSKRIIADCIYPPIAKNGTNFIISNNLLHHITNKEYTLTNWSEISQFALFNESTNYWAEGWSFAYIPKLIGLNNLAQKISKKIEMDSLQTLWTISELKELVRKYYEVIEEKTFFSEKIFFFASLFSLFLVCFGPPTPKIARVFFNKMLPPVSKFLTYYSAKLLIEYDAIQKKDKDSYVCWLLKSKLANVPENSNKVILVCPECREPIEDNTCNNCKTVFDEVDNMLFLLPKELLEKTPYISSNNDVLGDEHL